MMKQAAIRLHGICRMPEPTGNAKTPASWSGTAALMKRFHSLQKRVDADFEPIRRLQGYRNRLRQPLYDLTPYEDAIQAVYHLNNPRTPLS